MYEMNRAHQGRLAIRTFQVAAHALLIRGRYSLGGESGQTLESALRTLSPEVFAIGDDEKAHVTGPDKCSTCDCQAAVDSCPERRYPWIAGIARTRLNQQ